MNRFFFVASSFVHWIVWHRCFRKPIWYMRDSIKSNFGTIDLVWKREMLDVSMYDLDCVIGTSLTIKKQDAILGFWFLSRLTKKEESHVETVTYQLSEIASLQFPFPPICSMLACWLFVPSSLMLLKAETWKNMDVVALMRSKLEDSILYTKQEVRTYQ